MKDKIKFEDWLSKKWQTYFVKKERNGDFVINKDFVKNGESLYITARFTKQDDFCCGYLTNSDGLALVNGKGFTVDEFIEFLNIALKRAIK